MATLQVPQRKHEYPLHSDGWSSQPSHLMDFVFLIGNIDLCCFPKFSHLACPLSWLKKTEWLCILSRNPLLATRLWSKAAPSRCQGIWQASKVVTHHLSCFIWEEEGGSDETSLPQQRPSFQLWGGLLKSWLWPPHQRRGASLSSGVSARYLPFIGSRHRSCSWNTAQLSSSIKEKNLLHGKTSWNVHLGLPAVYMWGQLCNYNTHDDSEHRSQQPSSQGQRRCVNPTSGRPAFSEPRSPQVPAWWADNLSSEQSIGLEAKLPA